MLVDDLSSWQAHDLESTAIDDVSFCLLQDSPVGSDLIAGPEIIRSCGTCLFHMLVVIQIRSKLKEAERDDCVRV